MENACLIVDSEQELYMDQHPFIVRYSILKLNETFLHIFPYLCHESNIAKILAKLILTNNYIIAHFSYSES